MDREAKSVTLILGGGFAGAYVARQLGMLGHLQPLCDV
jgi:NADH dehydrogenase FAD-containing subunit